MSVVTVNSENFQKEVLQAELAVVDFWASWCGPCKMFGPIFEEVAGQMEGVTFAKLNVDDVPDHDGFISVALGCGDFFAN